MATQDTADSHLSEFGYSQEFDRTLKRYASFAIGFSFISITTGIFTTYATVLNTGGPAGIWTWPIVIVGQLMVALVLRCTGLAHADRRLHVPVDVPARQPVHRLAVGWFMFAFLIVDVVAVDYAVASAFPRPVRVRGHDRQHLDRHRGRVLVQCLLIMFSTIWSERVNNVAVGTELIGIGGLTILILVVGAIGSKLDWGHLFDRGAAAGAPTTSRSHPYIGKAIDPGLPAGGVHHRGLRGLRQPCRGTRSEPARRASAMWTSVLLSGILGFVFLIAITAATWDIPALTARARRWQHRRACARWRAGQELPRPGLLLDLRLRPCDLHHASRVAWAMARDERFPGYSAMRRVSRYVPARR